MAESRESVRRTAGGEESGARVERPPLKIFISYRREGDAGRASQLRDALADRFDVFFDIDKIADGSDFVDVINRSMASADVLVIVIGPRWLRIMDERARLPADARRPDHVRHEVEAGLERRPELRVIPVLVDGAEPFDEAELPRRLTELGRLNAHSLGHANWKRDVEELIRVIENPEEGSSDEPSRRRFHRPQGAPAVQHELDAEQLREVAEAVLDRELVPVLGPGVNAVSRAGATSADHLPDADELAAELADRLNTPPGGLAAVSEYASSVKGSDKLYRTLREALREKPAGPLHHALAELPDALKDLGVSRPYQMIITTNYDDALEQAFDSAHEEYDLVTYVARRNHPGYFVHVPCDSKEALPIGTPKRYSELPISDDGELERTVIVKIHGSAKSWPLPASSEPLFEQGEDCAITEDNYIDYLSIGPIGEIVPYQILDKLNMSELLYLGYNICDWRLRVVLQRIWQGKKPVSWAVQQPRDDLSPAEARLDRRLWMELGAAVQHAPLDEYLNRLRDEVASLAETPAVHG